MAIVVCCVGFVLGDTLLEERCPLRIYARVKFISFAMHPYPTEDRRILVLGHAMTEKELEDEFKL
jgi:hypothetical protein